jgi:hypothetical protein
MRNKWLFKNINILNIIKRQLFAGESDQVVKITVIAHSLFFG